MSNLIPPTTVNYLQEVWVHQKFHDNLLCHSNVTAIAKQMHRRLDTFSYHPCHTWGRDFFCTKLAKFPCFRWVKLANKLNLICSRSCLFISYGSRNLKKNLSFKIFSMVTNFCFYLQLITTKVWAKNVHCIFIFYPSCSDGVRMFADDASRFTPRSCVGIVDDVTGSVVDFSLLTLSATFTESFKSGFTSGKFSNESLLNDAQA